MKPRDLKKENTMSKKTKTGAWTKTGTEQENQNAGTLICAKHITTFKAEGGAE